MIDPPPRSNYFAMPRLNLVQLGEKQERHLTDK